MAEDFSAAISSIDEIIEDARNGKMYILVDAEDRENEGDLIIPANFATPEAINFMAKFGRGLICLTMTGERIAKLRLRQRRDAGEQTVPELPSDARGELCDLLHRL